MEDARPSVRLAEVVAPISLSTSLATGLPLEHGLRRTLLSVWLGAELGFSQDELHDAYYVALLGSVGCTIEASLFADVTGDDIAASARTATVDFTSPLETTAFALRTFGAGQPPLQRVRTLVGVAASGNRRFQDACRDVAVQVAEMLDIGSTIQQALAQCHERWNGRGGPARLKEDEIRLAARLFHVAHDAELHGRVNGIRGAQAAIRRQAGRLYDPDIAARFGALAESLFRRLEASPIWDAVLAAEPAPRRHLTERDLDAVLGSVARFVDLRSRFTLGHSTGVGGLAETTARRLGLSAGEVRLVRRAGLVHDLGRTGVPVALWDAARRWTDADRDRARQHPALTELLLARSPALSALGALAGLHHERLDGSGYRGVTSIGLPLATRILAAADAYHTKLERRPHRPALTPDSAAFELRRHAAEGRFDADVVTALLDGAVSAAPNVSRRPAPDIGLSEREHEVLRLVARGLSNREIAEALFLSPKTVGHHVQHIYDKLGLSTRVGATLFAVRHGLISEADSTAE